MHRKADMQHADLEFIRARYVRASNRYRPRHLRVVLLAEAPPDALDRFFYFEEVRRQDSLFLEVMGVLYPELKKAYLASGRDPEAKAELLSLFAEDGYWLLDVSQLPLSLSPQTLEEQVPLLLQRLKKEVDPSVLFILIKARVYDLCYHPLVNAGFRVHNDRIPFPGSGQQRVFREKFARAVAGSEDLE